MAGEYPVVRVGDVCYVTDGAHAKVDRQPHGVLYLTSKNIGVGRLLLGEVDYISEEDYERLFANSSKSQRRLSPGDVLVGIIGTFGNAYLYKKQDHFGVSSAVALLRPDQSRLEPRFLYYVVTSPIFRVAHSAYKAGSVQGYTNIPTIKYLPVPIPPLSEQRAIAHILGTLDDKIELNRRMNERLEAMARALFKSWFVDFDPVRAKAQSRDSRLPKQIAELFPDSFGDSELGEIPNGWEVGQIGDIAAVIDCLHAKKPERCDSGRPCLQLNNIRDDGLIDMEDTFFIDDSDYNKWISRMEATKGDCVITNVGRVGAVAQIPEGLKAALGRNMTGIRCKLDYPFPTFLVECLLSSAMRAEITRKMDSGTILNALNVKNIPKLRFHKASAKVMERFEHMTRPLRQKMEHNVVQSRTLAAARDTLLPKLISGELRVKKSEEAAIVI
jgi:type I restriction enzyme S subunit